MAEVLLAHSYFLRFDPKAYRQMEPYAPLGTLYAASCVREHGYDTAFFDAMLAESELEIEPFLIKHKPRFVVFFEDNFNYLSKMCLSRMREACFRMSAIARRQGCIVIVQGSDPVDHLQQYFSNG
ncbi:MAG TPA: radical SAM protein, partial [Candidatus Kapabacteria bacterium]|nr:radical SAM protein [Candidatus Kapabacteria bacterium]